MKNLFLKLGAYTIVFIWIFSGFIPILRISKTSNGTIQLTQTRWVRVVSADTGGPNTPSTVSGVQSGSCSDNMTWTIAVGDLTANDTNYVDITGGNWDSGNVTDELRMSDFGFSLAGTVTSIDGFVVEILGWTPSGTPAASYQTVSLFTSPGSNRGDNKATGTFPTADPGSTFQSFGASNDDWYPSGTWTEAEVESPNFGVALCFTAGEANATMSLDMVRITVTYTVSAVSAPSVRTDFTGNVGPTSAVLFGLIIDNGGENVTDHGFAYSTNSGLSTGVSTTSLGSFSGTGNFTNTINSLSANTTYYYRVYATNSGGDGLGIIRSFYTGNSTVTRKLRLFEGFIIKLIIGKIKLFGN